MLETQENKKSVLQKICDMPIGDALNSQDFKNIIGDIMYGSINGKNNDINKYISGVMNTIRTNDKLLKCSTKSIIYSILTSANLKLPVDSKHYAYLVPYKDKNGTLLCSLIIGYQAYLYLAKKDKDIDNIEPFIVYEGDQFEYYSDDKGNHFTYKPNFSIDKKNAKKLYGVAVLRYKENTGRQPQIVIMTYEEILKLAPLYFNYDTKKKELTNFWKDFEDEMIKKTVVRRLGKWFIKDVDLEMLNDIDNGMYEDKAKYYDEEGRLITISEEKKPDTPTIDELEKTSSLE